MSKKVLAQINRDLKTQSRKRVLAGVGLVILGILIAWGLFALVTLP